MWNRSQGRSAWSPRRLSILAGMVLTLSAAAWPRPVAAQSAPGGLLETATSTQIRSRVVPTLPARGKFTFPAPYNTVAARLTNAADCGGQDCVDYVGYSYWRNSNNHVGSDVMLIFISLNRARGGAGPTLFSYDKRTDEVTVVGPLFDANSPFSWATGEGWYWSGTAPTKLYVNDGPRLLRYDVMSRQFETVFDVSAQFGANRYIWQIHSSSDDRVHSATLRASTTYAALGCVVYREDRRQFSFFEAIGDYDECQVDKSGRWLVIKENVDGAYGEDNRVVDLETGQERVFLDQDGAAGHSDVGHGYMIAEDNWSNYPGAVRVWSLDQALPGAEPQGRLVYRTTSWDLNIGHVSHGNARPGVPLEQQIACGGQAVRQSVPRANEIVCFRLDTSLQVLVVAPTMTDLAAPGGGDDYAKLPKGNLDVTGQYFIWTSNAGGSRLDAFVVKVPSHLLVAAGGPPVVTPPPADSTAPVVTISAPAAGATVSGTVTVSAKATDNVGVVGVQFKLNGADLGPEVTTPPFSTSWITTGQPNGKYTITAVARDAAGNTKTSPKRTITVSNAGVFGPAQDVVWTKLRNAVASGSSLSKVGGCDGCADAGGVSSVTIKTNGFVELDPSETWSLRYIGLGLYNAVQPAARIKFAWALQPGGRAEVRELGTYRAETTFAPGDVLRIEVQGGAVTYLKNGQPIYRSALVPASGMRVMGTLYTASSTLARVRIAPK